MHLDDLAKKYSTDKINHGFSKVYDTYFKNKRLYVKNILEIGIFQGSSARMWKEYFPNATIYAIDIDEKTLFTEDRIVTKKVNQAVRSELLKFLTETNVKFDFIIDDGSHEHEHQQLTFDVCFDWLMDGGLYCIEDLHTINHINYGLPYNSPNCTWNVLSRLISDNTLSTSYITPERCDSIKQKIEYCNLYKMEETCHLGNTMTSMIKKTAKDCVILASWIPKEDLVDEYIALFKTYLRDCDFYVGCNPSCKKWYEELQNSGLNIFYDTLVVAPEQVVNSDCSPYQLALKNYKKLRKHNYDLVYFIHTKGASHPNYKEHIESYIVSLIKNRELVEISLQDSEVGGMCMYGELNNEITGWFDKFISPHFNTPGKCLDIMWLTTNYAIKGHIIDKFIDECSNEFFNINLQERYLFEAAFPSIIDKLGYKRIVKEWWGRNIPYTEDKLDQLINKWKLNE